MNNLLADIPVDLPEELVETLLEDKSLRIERIVSHGHASSAGFWYDQPQHEWVLLLQGEARLQFDEGGKLISLRPGDAINIPAHKRHRVEWTTPKQPTVWLAIHYGATTNAEY
jgi:cupin 2 domain-containing protein